MTNLFTNILQGLFLVTKDWGVAILLLTLGVKLVLMPFSLRQKLSVGEKVDLNSKTDEIKKKYKNDENRMNEELMTLYSENSKSMLGGLLSFIQIPIIMVLFKIIRNTDINSGSILLPWISSLKVHDSSYIIPLIYTIVSLGPSILNYIAYIRGLNKEKPLLSNAISIVIISIMITLKSPAAMGIYFIGSSIITLLEDIIYRVLSRNKLIKEV